MQKNNTEHLKELDTSFHSMIYEASGSRMIERILSDLHRNTKAYRRQSICVPGRLEKMMEEHREILIEYKIGISETFKENKTARKLLSEAIENKKSYTSDLSM